MGDTAVELTDITIERLDSNKVVTLDDCYNLLPKPPEGFRGTYFNCKGFWPFVLFVRGLSGYPAMIPSQWELYIISGKEPRAELLMTSTEEIVVKEVDIRHTFRKEKSGFFQWSRQEALVQIFASERVGNSGQALLPTFVIHIEGEAS